MSTVSALYHIVINTYRRQMTIPPAASDELYRYICGIVRNLNCKPISIGGIENHIHLLVDLRPDVTLSSLMRDIKQSSSKWAKASSQLPRFEGWGKEYGAFSVSNRNKDAVISYIANQREHHKRVDFDSEFKALVLNAGCDWNDYKLT